MSSENEMKLLAEVVGLIGWELDESCEKTVWHVVRSGQYVMLVRFHDKRIKVSAKWPRYGDHVYRPDSSPFITVSAKRSPQAIAADIKRRFIDKYVGLYDEMLAAVYAARQRDDTHKSVMNALAVAAGGVYEANRQGWQVSLYSGKGIVRVDHQVIATHSNGRVALSFENVTQDLAEMLLNCYRVTAESLRLRHGV